MKGNIIKIKHVSYILLCISFVLFLAVIGLLYLCLKYKMIASDEMSSRQRAEWTIYDGIRNIGESVSLDSVAKGHHMILRYDSQTCLTCIAKAEKLLEEVFGREYLKKELCCIGAYGQVEPSDNILGFQSEERITPMDDVYTPYFCLINDNGEVLFTLTLYPDNYDYNWEILTRLKKHLQSSKETDK